jgi:hypothetical protein
MRHHTLALLQKRIEGDDSLLRLAQLRFQQAGLSAEFYTVTPDELEGLWQFRPARAASETMVVAHLQRGLNLLEEHARTLILDFAKRFRGRLAGLVVHDQPETVSHREGYVRAVREIGRGLETIPDSPRLFIEYAAGLEPAEFAGFFERVREVERVSACIDVGHVGVRQSRKWYSRIYPGQDVCVLTSHDPRLPEVIADVQQAVRSALPAVLGLTAALGKLGKPLHFHLHDGHPLSSFSPYGASDHLSFLTRIAIPFEFEGKWSLDLMYGPSGLHRIVSKSLELAGAARHSFTLEIQPTEGRVPVGDGSYLFHHWRDKTNAERMNYWLAVLLENHQLLVSVLEASGFESQTA